MRITFDPSKDAVNFAKHGVSLARTGEIEWETLWAKPDTRRDYGEPRMIGYGYIGVRLLCVVSNVMPKLKKGTIVPTPQEDVEIAAGIAADPDTYELGEAEFKVLRPRGRPRIAHPKQMVSLRLDQDVLAALKATGPGWQGRVNELLRQAVKR